MPENGRSTKEGLEGKYANHFDVGFNASEVVIDFGQAFTDRAGAAIHTRIVMSPASARALQAMLGESTGRRDARRRTEDES
jgi:hypothetical protein